MFLLDLAQVLRLPRHSTTATALVFWHKFDAFARTDDAAKAFDQKLIMSACVHLACKQTELPRKLRDILNAGFWIEQRGNPNIDPFLDTDNDLYWELKESLVAAELVLLRVLAFDTNVETPHSWVVYILQKVWLLAEDPHSIAASHDSNQLDVDERYALLAQNSWAIANDAFLVPQTCVGVNEVVLAAACVYLASQAANLSHLVSIENICYAARIKESTTIEIINTLLQGLPNLPLPVQK
ncbi:cyclin-like protein [Chytriomyces sp. MP71]|nr:cyclin-like protein [Chytriomyces sp. MP71]